MDPALIQRIWIMLAAVSGAIMPMTLCTGMSRGRALVRVLGGTLLAIFVTPAIQIRYMADSSTEVYAAVSFLTGCFGLNLIAIAQRVLETSGDEFVQRIARSIFRGVGK